MFERSGGLSVSRQCEKLEVIRSSVYSTRRGVYRGDRADSKFNFELAGPARDEDASRGTSGG